MKLNKKGYMLIEIVLASVLAMSIALYLLNLTYQFKNKDEDIYQSISYSSDKIAITKNIMNDLDKQVITKIEKSENNEVVLTTPSSGTEEKRKIQINNPENKEVTITYGKINNDGSFDKNDSSYYQKNLQKSLLFKEIKINNENENIITIKIILESMYTDDDYSIKLLAKTAAKTLVEDNSAYLNKKKKGTYVKYTGNNGCAGELCDGHNANSSSDNFGFCRDQNYKFNSSGWRIAYIKEQTVYLISAGSPECICTGNNTQHFTSCNPQIHDTTTNSINHLNNLNSLALNYCNSNFSYEGECNNNNSWNINIEDFQQITGMSLIDNNDLQNPENYKNNDLINNGSYYWFATHTPPEYVKNNSVFGSTTQIFLWSPSETSVSSIQSSNVSGIRPVLRLRSNVKVTGGSGTYSDPYTIE